MKINFQNEFSKRFTTALILTILLIGIFSFGNIGIYLMIMVLSYFSFSEINNLKDFKIKLQFYIPFLIIICFLVSKRFNFNVFKLNSILHCDFIVFEGGVAPTRKS